MVHRRLAGDECLTWGSHCSLVVIKSMGDEQPATPLLPEEFEKEHNQCDDGNHGDEEPLAHEEVSNFFHRGLFGFLVQGECPKTGWSSSGLCACSGIP